jgi:hypothetical protein
MLSRQDRLTSYQEQIGLLNQDIYDLEHGLLTLRRKNQSGREIPADPEAEIAAAKNRLAVFSEALHELLLVRSEY